MQTAVPAITKPEIGVVEDLGITPIDYTMSIEGMVQAGKYPCIDENLDLSEFPLRHTPAVDHLYLVIVEIVMPRNQKTPSKVAEQLMRDNGIIPTDLRQALSIGIHYPERQLQNPLVVIGEEKLFLKPHYALVLSSKKGQRSLIMSGYDLVWNQNVGSLAYVCKLIETSHSSLPHPL